MEFTSKVKEVKKLSGIMCGRLFFAVVTVFGAGLSANCGAEESGLHLKVDFALPMWDSSEPWPESAKPGWWHWIAPQWADMYGHDHVWEDGSSEKPSGDGIAGSGVHALVTAGFEGYGGLYLKGLCLCSLSGGCAPMGSPEGQPIANTWYRAMPDRPGHVRGNTLLLLTDVPAGEYELISYHNNWDQCGWSFECLACTLDSDPCGNRTPIPSITANPLPSEPLPGYNEWALPAGTGGGVTPIENAYDVFSTHVYEDDEVATSRIRFRTDGSEVLVIYEAPVQYANLCMHAILDEGSGFLNAFELILEEPVITASMPMPFNDAGDVPRDTKLSWLASVSGVLHDVYFGTDRQAGANAVDPNSPPGRGRLDVTTFDPGGLELGTTYYWRVDEVNYGEPNSPWKGELWSFTTAACIVVEDFESYPDSDAVQTAWTPLGGAWIELQTEQYHKGMQSMELQYFDRSGYKFSEAGFAFDKAQDWSRGVDSITFFFKGFVSNVADKMYVAIEDVTGASSAASYEGDVEDLETESWKGCGVKLEEFTGVDLATVSKLFIGVGDRGAVSSSGASGTIWIDDVALCVPSCVKGTEPAGDLTGDCFVNFRDHAVIGREWHRNDGPIAAIDPKRAGLKAWYRFDSNTSDFSGNGNDAALFQQWGTPSPRWAVGKRGTCLYFGLSYGNRQYGVFVVDHDNPVTPNAFR